MIEAEPAVVSVQQVQPLGINDEKVVGRIVSCRNDETTEQKQMFGYEQVANERGEK